MLNLQNPIPRLQADPQKVRKLFDQFGIIPYYGTASRTSQKTLRLFYDLAKNSPSNRACMRDKKMYSFQSGLKFTERNTPGLYVPETQDVSPNDGVEIIESYGVELTRIIEDSQVMLDHWNESGNIWLRIQIEEIAGQRFLITEPIHYLNCALLHTEPDEPRQLVVTESWDLNWWKDNEPDVIPVSYIDDWNWSENMETVLHIKNEGSIYYGRPLIESVLEWMGVEFFYGSLTSKISSTEIISKNVVAIEGVEPTLNPNSDDKEDERDAIRQIGKTLRKLTTAEGKHGEVTSLGVMSYPEGANQPTVLSFDVNRDYRYQEMALKQASDFIYAVHGWDKQITGFAQSRSQLGSDAIISLFKKANVGTIYPIQKMFGSIWNKVIDEAKEQFGDQREMPGINFASLADIMIEKHENAIDS